MMARQKDAIIRVKVQVDADMLAEAFDRGRTVEYYTALGWSVEDALTQPVDPTEANPYRNQP